MTELFFKLPQHIAARRDIRPTAKIVYAAILDRIGRNSKSWAGAARLGEDTGLHRETVLAAADQLAKAGLLAVRKGGLRVTNEYSIPNGEGSGKLPLAENNRYRKTTASAVGKQPPAQAEENRCNQTDPITRPNNVATPIPESLDTPAFREAWAQWVHFRKEARYPMPPTTVKAQLAKLAKAGPDVAAKMIEQSIANGWRGLFPLREDQQVKGFTAAKSADVSAYGQIGKSFA